MPQHIKIHTDFDITNTGVVRNFKPGLLPKTVNGKVVLTEKEWTKYRRQQSNWETIIQIISLRTQPLNIRTLVNENNWTLEFDVDHVDVYRKGDDELGLLKEDFANVPLLTGLDESISDGFIVIDGNTRLETYKL